MTKPLWKGTLSLGQINIPIRLFPETRPEEPVFSLVDRRDLAPIGMTRINKKTGAAVPNEEVARAATLPDGNPVIVPDEILDDLSEREHHAVRIVAFTPLADISPAYFQTPYFLEPSPEAGKGYEILLEALLRTKHAAIARTVLLHHERIAAVWAEGALLMMSVLRWPAELRRPDRLTREPAPPEEVGITPGERDAARRLVETMSAPWDPSGFRDEYRDRIRAYVQRKGRPEPPAPSPLPAATPQGQLLQFLERSVRDVEEQKKSRPSRTA